MKDRGLCVAILLCFVFVFVSYTQEDGSPFLKSPYLGQKPPGMTPEIFAPGIVSTCLQELNPVFSPDGQEFYFCVRTMGASSLFVMKCVEEA